MPEKKAIPELTFTRSADGGFRFSKIVISPIVRNHKYVAEFWLSYDSMPRMKAAECSIAGGDVAECIAKTSTFLNTVINRGTEIEIKN